MTANIMRLFLVGVVLLFGGSSIHQRNTLFIGIDHQQFLCHAAAPLYLGSQQHLIEFEKDTVDLMYIGYPVLNAVSDYDVKAVAR